MALQFGPFSLEEAGRVLMCARHEIALQPRVFDLLVYLVRNRDRVVTKDELLDAVWPNVTVTDNSLQRAVSAIRAALRQGDMEGAIRNVPGKGYRFSIDCKSDDHPEHEPEAERPRLAPVPERRQQELPVRCDGRNLLVTNRGQKIVALLIIGCG